MASAIGVEVWAVPLDRFGAFVAEVPAPLAIGIVTLDDSVRESHAARSAEDFSRFGGWSNYPALTKCG